MKPPPALCWQGWNNL